MFMMNKLLKPECKVFWKYFTHSLSQQSINSTLLRSYPLCEFIAVRFNHVQVYSGNPHKRLENDYYHSFLMKNKKYSASIAFLDYVPEETLCDVDFALNDTFEDKHGVTLSLYLHVVMKYSQQSDTIYDDARFSKLCETLSSKFTSMHEDHVLNVMKTLALWDESKRNQVFYAMCRTIDKMFLQRYKLWGYDRCLLVMDHFYRLQVIRFSETSWNCMKRLWRDPNRLTSAQVVHAMFLVNAHRSWHPAVHFYNLETYLRQAAYELSVEECAILALAFFKTQHKIRNLDLLKLLYEKLFIRVSTLDAIPLTSLLKLFRSCSYYGLREHMLQLIALLHDAVDKHPYVCCTHIALLGTSMLVCDSKLCEKIARRLIEEISVVRIKDIERTILAFETFNFESKTEPSVYEVALKELVKRKDDVFDYPTPVYSAVTYLALKGYHNFELTNFLLSEDTIKKAFNHKDLSKYNCHLNLLTISDGIKIDFPEYSGNLLNESLRKDLYLHQSFKIPTEDTRKPLSMYDKVLFQARSIFRDIFGGSDFVHYTYVLPHLSRPDLVFRLNGDIPIRLPENVLSSNYMNLELPSKTEDWYVVTSLGTNTVLRNTDQPIGNMCTKMRHLKKLGYRVLCIKEHEWLNKTKAEHADYLRNLLENGHQSNQPEVQQPIRVELR